MLEDREHIQRREDREHSNRKDDGSQIALRQQKGEETAWHAAETYSR